MTSQVEAAARRELLNDDTVRSLTNGRVYKYRAEPDLQVDGTGRLIIVLNRQPGWQTPDPVKTGRFPVLQVKVIVDPSRSVEGWIETLDGESRAFALQTPLDRIFHFRRGWWCGRLGKQSGRYVISSQRWNEPTLQETPGTRPPAEQGDLVTVNYEYALTL